MQSDCAANSETRRARSFEAGRSAEYAARAGLRAPRSPGRRHALARRSGEIDLIVRDGEGLIFVEVKKSRSFEAAAERLGRRQMDRICGAAGEYSAREPRGALTEMRFDVALVDGHGQVRVIENAFGET